MAPTADSAEPGKPAHLDEGPKAGPPWDSPIEKAHLAFLDLEMTGLDRESDRVIEICVERRHGRQLEGRLETLLDPGPLSRLNTSVHGIDAEMLHGAPSFVHVAGHVTALLEGAVLVAHGASSDVEFLEAELARAGKPFSVGPHLDTLALSRRAIFANSHSLDALSRQLGFEREVAHRAAADVRALVALFDRLVEELKPNSPRDLWNVRVGQRQARPEVVRACELLAHSGDLARICWRPSRRAPRILEGVVTAVRSELDPPRVMGYALPDRGRFELRADRILWVVRAG